MQSAAAVSRSAWSWPASPDTLGGRFSALHLQGAVSGLLPAVLHVIFLTPGMLSSRAAHRGDRERFPFCNSS